MDPDNVRNRPPGGGGLYDIGCYAILTARYIFGAEPTRVAATIDWCPNFKTDRLASALLEFPGGRQLTFTVGTQSSAHQRVTIMGEKGRIEVMIPFNAPIDRPTDSAVAASRSRMARSRLAPRAALGSKSSNVQFVAAADQALTPSFVPSLTPTLSPTFASSFAPSCTALRVSAICSNPSMRVQSSFEESFCTGRLPAHLRDGCV